MKQLCLLFVVTTIAVLLFSTAVRAAEYQPPEPCTPDQQYCVEILAKRLAKSPEYEDSTLIVRHNGKVLARYPTFGYVLNIYWSPERHYLALNNRRANSGDWLWVISLVDGKAIKMPTDLAEELHKDAPGSPGFGKDDDGGLREVQQKFPECAGEGINHEYLLAMSWKSDNELSVFREVTCMHFDDVIEAENVYRIANDRIVLQERKIETRKETVRD